jgi:hypothetical protein
MASLKIPDKHLAALKTIVALAPFEIDDLLSALSNLPLSVDLDGSSTAIASRIRSAAIVDPENIVQTIISLSTTRSHQNKPVDEFVGDVLEALDEFGEVDKARGNLTRLLSFAPLDIVTKAYHLLHDQERTSLGAAKILTDARPIFGQEVGTPAAFLINHVLKLTYLKDGKSADFYIALDASDISELKRLLERAEAKAESLKQTMGNIRIPIVQS